VDGDAIILAGGKSSRMGRPKALLLFGGEPLIAHITRALRSLFAEVIVVAAPGQELPALPVRVVYDDLPYQGPVGGIYYGLRHVSGDVAFVTSCDAPFLNLRLVSQLAAQISNYDVVVPVWEERFQPLHAVYRKSVLPLLHQQLERGELRPVFLYDKVRTLKVEEAQIRRFDPEGLSFLNMNTPEDYATALERWRNLRQTPETETIPPPPIADSSDPLSVPVSISVSPSVSSCASVEGDLNRQRVETETAPPSPDTSPSISVPVSVSISSLISVTVELFGVPRLLAKTRAVPLSLPRGATLSHLYTALAEEHPVLLGKVISADKANLATGYACNINGLDFVRNPGVEVNSGDRIFILSADAGG
jgi:molybdopterin-guanine dinucleotide biosynthesis protein A